MMTQCIPTKASGNQLGATASAANLAKRSGMNDFEMFFDKSIKRETNIPVRDKAINGKSKNVINQDKTQATEREDKATSIIEKTIKSDTCNTDSKAVDITAEEKKKPVDPIDSDLMGQIQTIIDQIRNAIMEELDLTPKEIDTMMDQLGLGNSDLTDPESIKMLVLADAQTTDPLAMLLDEQLGDTFQGLLTKLEDIKNEADLKLTDDEMKLILEQGVNSEEGQMLLGVDEADTILPQVVSKETNGETLDAKDSTNATFEDSYTIDQRSVIATKGEAELKDADDSEARTEGFEAFLDKLSANYDKPIAELNSNTEGIYDIREIAQQIIEQIRVDINPEQTTMELQLNPEHLGKVNLTISSKEGLMTAHFSVQNDLAKEAIEGQLITLKDTLDQQGIKVESIEVTVASYTFDQKSPSDDTEQRMHKKQRSGHKITFDEAVAMSEEPLEDADNMNLAGTMGYNINYRA